MHSIPLQAVVAAAFALAGFAVEPPAPVGLPSLAGAQVIQVSPAGNDTGDGSDRAPLATLGQALKRATAAKRAGKPVRVVLAAGVYREGDFLLEDLDQEAPLSIEAAQPGSAILSGADPVIVRVEGEDWLADPPRVLEPSVNPWAKQVTIGALGLRREMVVIGGVRLAPVADAPGEGQYSVSTSIRLRTARGADPASVEVSSRTVAMTIRRCRNVALHGLVVRHFANGPCVVEAGEPHAYAMAAFLLDRCTGVVIADCRFVDNNWTGFAAERCERIAIQRCAFDGNGGGGLGGGGFRDALVEDCTSDRNNWRGAAGAYYAWSNGGIKWGFGSRRVLLRRHRAVDNDVVGVHLDWDNEHIRYEDCVIERNREFGVILEASRGPIELGNCRVVANRGIGVHGHGASNVLLDSCVVAGNAIALNVYGDDREVEAFDSKQRHPCSIHHWTLRNCELSTAGVESGSLRMIPDWVKASPTPSTATLFTYSQREHWAAFAASFSGENNRYIAGERAFVDVAGAATDLAGWQVACASEATSLRIAP